MCSELDYGVVDGVGGHTECLRDRICPELPDGGMPSESEKVVEEGVPLQQPNTQTSTHPKSITPHGQHYTQNTLLHDTLAYLQIHIFTIHLATKSTYVTFP